MVGRSTLLVVLVAAVTGNKDQKGVFVFAVALWKLRIITTTG
jgi:hypothetical protein